jgi:starch phosphorylase
MEFGLHEDFPIYAGGLGILAGDYIEGARDERLPVVGVGIRWARGYSRQRVNADGKPVDEFPEYRADFLEDTGIRVRVRVAAREVEARVWHVERWGSAPLYLLEPVEPEDAWITHRLYENVPERASPRRYCSASVACVRSAARDRRRHLPLQRGHAVFAGVELIADRMESGVSFSEAWEAARRSIVFTTHTPIPAGTRRIPSPTPPSRRCLELVDEEMQAIGGDPFNMTVAGLRLARRANAVSQLHGEVAREMWEDVEERAEIIAITNGVHVPTWQDARIAAAASRSSCGPRMRPSRTSSAAPCVAASARASIATR